ncbi:host attachment family protein [Pseudosulfitobacter pseudonitzschiae]|uniref:host attachment family protein n=1 Tax=Pseudosulfitobacter pseudonitzschiae TaxID=1402135 RepID=UPI001AF7F493|nr:host attachment family protein [Pseudosulfitobacter pseudonitzschiae]MBM1817821.1 host attachment protein [Pseudosulfitobacter pseudonitzschiae]MBM1834878.1 host attachment protein [Pseudosulfitobacter pseudonitzschiae]MBM1839679.1 host attachment protein [Pseudosulfitobacter pseudonitzschiae]MBM1844594.1 host attachment protein [Pseudosulfitobacter pseudonitzschiae]MBM1849365.1 host attachment protein [Pseudosulfitobacter pseudonitzschiae]
MAKLEKDTWIVVTDSEKALFMRNLTDLQDPNFEVTDTEQQDNPSDREQSANRPGRMQDGGVNQRSALDDTDWHELAKERFAKDLSDMLYKEAHAGHFKKLVIVASPKVLGILREEMHSEVTDKIVAEIPKTLTNHSVSEIEKIVKHELEAA